MKHGFWGEQFNKKTRYFYIAIKVDLRSPQEEIKAELPYPQKAWVKIGAG